MKPEQDFEQIMYDEEHKEDLKEKQRREFHEGRVKYFKLLDTLKQKEAKKDE